MLEESTWYAPGSGRLSLLLLSMVILVLYQQLLTLRYISLRPELSTLAKRANKRYYRLCGNAYSSMNPRNYINYLYLSVIVGEFITFSAVVFHPRLPWSEQGSRGEDASTLSFLRGFLPDFIIGSYNVLLLTVLLLLVFVYLVVVGEFIASDRRASDPLAVVLVEFLSATCYSTVVARLFSIAGDYTTVTPRGVRMLAMLTMFLYATTATFVATLRGDPDLIADGADVKFQPLFLVVSNILKGLLGISATVLGNLGAENLSLRPDGAPSAPPPPPSTEPVRGGPLLFVLFALAVLGAHVVLLRRWRTCSVSFVSRVRLYLLGVVAWGLVVAFFMVLAPWSGWLLLLIVTWSLLAAAVAGYGVHRVFYAEPPDQESDEVKQQRVRDVRDNIMRHGACRKQSIGARISQSVMGGARASIRQSKAASIDSGRGAGGSGVGQSPRRSLVNTEL